MCDEASLVLNLVEMACFWDLEYELDTSAERRSNDESFLRCQVQYWRRDQSSQEMIAVDACGIHGRSRCNRGTSGVYETEQIETLVGYNHDKFISTLDCHEMRPVRQYGALANEPVTSSPTARLKFNNSEPLG
ncbi:hypothetical protein MPTK2_2g20580 [Marchantia polymorpha subsp. ruderalis]